MKGYPSWFLSALAASVVLVFVSGLLLVPTMLTMRLEAELAWRLPGAGRILTAALHAGAGLALLMLTGALWSVHMRANWRRGRQRGSGATLGSLMLVLAASALGIYYLGDDGLGTGAALLHLAAGILLALPLAWHWIRGRSSATARRARRLPEPVPSGQHVHTD